MECQASDSKKVLKVFDASKSRHNRKKKDGFEDSNSLATDDSTNGCQGSGKRGISGKASLQNLSVDVSCGAKHELDLSTRDRESSPSVSAESPRRLSASPGRHRRVTRDGISLALKGCRASTLRSISPKQDGDAATESLPRDPNSLLYALFEETLERDKRKQRHSRRREEGRGSREREGSSQRGHRSRHRRRRDEPPARDREKERSRKDKTRLPGIDQTALLETFAKLCVQMNEKSPPQDLLPRTQSHKSLQCEVIRHDSCNMDRPEHDDRRLEKEYSRQAFRDNISPSRTRSHNDFHNRDSNFIPSNGHLADRKSHCVCYSPYDKDGPKYESKLNVANSRMRNTDSRYHEYQRDNTPARSCANHDYYRSHHSDRRVDRDYEDRREHPRDRPYDDRRGYCEQKTSRSFDWRRDGYDDRTRRTNRSDYNRDKYYTENRDFRDKRYNDSARDKYYDEKPCRDRNFNTLGKERSKRNLERFERNSIASREDDYRDKERDSGLSGADGETSTVSGRSNCLRVVKQEISEQREAMDKMMKLWKELMRCFKGISQTQGQDNRGVQESAATVRDSAAAQLRLWRECMRRYETVARDVGDTDARLMEEINKQRSEMSEMANMWQECLQRYRDMSNDFNSLKQQLSTPDSPARLSATPLVCAEGEGAPPLAPYRLHSTYPPMAPPVLLPEYHGGGSPLRQRASAPPAWWWPPEPAPRSPRRRSSPDSRGSRDRRHRHRDRERDDTRYKEKPKPSAARSEQKHRKR